MSELLDLFEFRKHDQNENAGVESLPRHQFYINFEFIMPKTVDTSQFEYKDMFGNDIKVGDYIVYAGTAGRSPVLRAGRVLELTVSKGGYNVEPKIKAESWNYYRSTGHDDRERSGKQKAVSLGFLSRLIVVPESLISDKIKKDLAGPVSDYWGQPI